MGAGRVGAFATLAEGNALGRSDPFSTGKWTFVGSVTSREMLLPPRHILGSLKWLLL